MGVLKVINYPSYNKHDKRTNEDIHMYIHNNQTTAAILF